MSVYKLLGTKREMSQFFEDDGKVVPVTILEVGPCTVAQVKTEETDGYNAVQIGFGDIKLSRVPKPQQGHWKNSDSAPRRRLREVRLENAPENAAGDVVSVADVFNVGDWVDVIGRTKGRGFQGGMKRYNFQSGPRSHGSKNIREPGSTGQATTPARRFKGQRLPGHMGTNRVTTRNILVVRVDADRNLLYVRGSVPGHNGGDIEVRKAKAKRMPKEDRALRKGKK
ncbi:50S ribosomal protein L3 [Planctomycetota bacterium]|nr:50S ribosomal protein L3 [Planctomycetota bacterium]